MTRLDIFALRLILAASLVVAGVAVEAQELGSSATPWPSPYPSVVGSVPAPEGPELSITPLPEVSEAVDPGLIDVIPPLDPAEPGLPASPDPPPEWTWQRTTANQAGTVNNTHRQMISEDGTQELREHVVTNPNREMIQTWERTQAEDGYLIRRMHTWNDPDGTLSRQHQWSRFGTDPDNYTREHEITLRDGRSIMHTQTRNWDGTTGTMERTFLGPNGQTKQFQRPWAPDDSLPADPLPTGVLPSDPLPNGVLPSDPLPIGVLPPDPLPIGVLPSDPLPTGVLPSDPLPSVDQPKRWGWLENLNPFRNRERSASRFGAASPGRSGFTVGTGAGNRMRSMPRGLSNRQPGLPGPNSKRPLWAGPSRSVSPPGQATPKTPHPQPGRGRSL